MMVMLFVQCLLLTAGVILLVSTVTTESKGQPEVTSPVNITDMLLDKYPFVTVEYETNSAVILRGDEDSLLLLNGSLAPLWEAIDDVSNAGYILNEVTSSGMGSQGNPTRFYAVMMKE